MDRVFAWAQGATDVQDCVCHDCPSDGPAGAYRIKIVPTLSDNYSYLVINTNTHQAVVVDAADGMVVRTVAARLGVTLVAVLTTHYHADHCGGNADLAAQTPSLEIIAGAGDADRTPCVTKRVGDGEAFVCAGLAFAALETPGHTRGSVCFLLDARDGQAPAVFTGDTLFIGGCGRFFEAPPETMRDSLAKLARLDPATRVFPGHEYTAGNMKFCCALEPDSADAQRACEETAAQREKELPTASTMAREMRLNPFMRSDDAAVQRAAGCEGDAVKTLATIRRRKDTFTTVGKVITLFLDTKAALGGGSGP